MIISSYLTKLMKITDFDAQSYKKSGFDKVLLCKVSKNDYFCRLLRFEIYKD